MLKQPPGNRPSGRITFLKKLFFRSVQIEAKKYIEHIKDVKKDFSVLQFRQQTLATLVYFDFSTDKLRDFLLSNVLFLN